VDYFEFFFAAGKLNEADPAAGWQAEGRRQQQLVDWLTGRRLGQLLGAFQVPGDLRRPGSHQCRSVVRKWAGGEGKGR